MIQVLYHNFHRLCSWVSLDTHSSDLYNFSLVLFLEGLPLQTEIKDQSDTSFEEEVIKRKSSLCVCFVMCIKLVISNLLFLRQTEVVTRAIEKNEGG